MLLGSRIAPLQLRQPSARVRVGGPPLLSDGRELKWSASASASEPCESRLATFLAQIAESGDDLIIRLDESIETCTALGGGKYSALVHPLKLPGLTVEPTAIIEVEAVPEGVRYTTLSVTNEFSGVFADIVEKLQPQIEIRAYTELKVTTAEASEADEQTTATPPGVGASTALAAESDFALTVPLPAWWPWTFGAEAAGNSEHC